MSVAVGSDPPTRGALNGAHIVECAQGIAAPYTAMLLAEQGATVIKVEPPLGDRARRLPGFHVWNRSKRSVVADLTTRAGRDQLRGLCAGADIFISDWFPTEPTLGYAALAAINPRLIHCWMPPYGSRGEDANAFPSDDLVAARSGLLGSQWGYREGPVFLTLPVASYGTAMLAAGAVCSALLARQRTGVGQQLEVSWLAGAMAMQTGGLIEHPVLLRVMALVRDPLGPIPVYRLFKAKDGWLFIACGNSTFWNKLCLLLERPEMVSDPRFDGAPWAVAPAHWAELKSLIQSIIATRPRDAWLELLKEADIPCAPVCERADFLKDPQVRQLGMCQEVVDPELGRTIQIGIPVDLRNNPGAIQGPAPLLGSTPLSTVAPELARNQKHDQPTASTLGDRTATGRERRAPLDGVLVLDFTSYIAGPVAGLALALAGADVIKIEPRHGDPFRVFGFGFYGWNQGKRSLALDFSKPDARPIVHDLVRRADVVLENLRPGATQRLGIDHKTLSALNPRLIYGSLTAFGSSGPRGHEAGFDPLLQARAGIMAAQGGHNAEPVFLACAVCDYAAGLLCAFAVTAALFARTGSGRGQLVETSLAQAALAVQSGEFIFYRGRPDMENGGPDLIGSHPLRRAYECRDGWIFVSAVADHVNHARESRSLLAAAFTASDPTTEVPHGPTGERLAALFRQWSCGEALGQLATAGIPAMRISSIAEVFQDPQIAVNDLLHTATVDQFDASGTDNFRQTGTLVHYAATPVKIARIAPKLGEHTDDVLRHILGYEPRDIEALHACGVLVRCAD